MRGRFAELEAGAETGETVRLAGRVMGRRGHGKAMFLDLVDAGARIQLHATADTTPDYERFGETDLGDLVGIEGEVFQSRRGELSVRVRGWQLLAKCLRPLPEKWHGLTDTELRYRHRYVDLITSPESRADAVARSRAVTAMRAALDEEGFVEVETPVLQPLYGGGAAKPFTTYSNELEQDMYLRIADELYLKRLIVGGLERVYELSKDFRNESISFKHSPEFTMLEWYQAYADYRDGMALVEKVVSRAGAAAGSEVDLAPPWPRRPLRQAIIEEAGVDPLADRDRDRLVRFMQEQGIDTGADHTWAQAVDHLLSHFVEARSTRPVFITDYPVELSPFSKRSAQDPSAGGAVRGVLQRHGDRQRLQRAERPDRAARPLPGAAACGRRRRRRDAADGRGFPAGAGVRDAAHLRRRHRHRPADDAAAGQAQHPRGDPVSGAAAARRGRHRLSRA